MLSFQKEMTIDYILAQLQSNDGHFPREAVLEAVAQRDEIIPALIAVLRDAAVNPEPYISDQTRMIHVYAMYLLAQFRVHEAYPILIQLVSLPGEMPFDLIGDTVTEALGSILASVCGGDIAGIQALIENDQVNGYVRSSAMKALLSLVACGERSRDEIVAYFLRLFQSWERKPNDVWACLANVALDLWPDDSMMQELKRVWDEELFEPFILNWQDIEWGRAYGLDASMNRLRRRNRLVTDVVAEMSWWAAFKEDRAAEKRARDERFPPRLFPEPAKPIRRTAPKVGRNDPCPCGNGTKYKKCCGA
jgi:hypothetical protein